MSAITMPRTAAAGLRLSTLILVSSSPLGLSVAYAQQAAAPAELDAITVESQKQKKKAAASNKGKAKAIAKAAPAAASGPDQPGVPSSGGRGEATKPGLNLNAEAQTGSRLGLTPLETPASVEIIPGGSIRDRGQQSVNDAVTQNATGFTSTASPGNGGTSLTARGFSGHNSVMRMYDGTRLYLGNGTMTFPFDTWSAERIEVLRGPASVIYGEGAIGGVINVVPKKPTDFFTHEAEVAIGTDATRRIGLGSGGPINDRVSYRFDFSGIQSDGWLDRESDFKSAALSGALSFRATKDLKITVSNDYGDQSPIRYNGTPLVNGKVVDSLRDTNYNVKDSKIHYVDNWTQIKTEWSPADWFDVRNVSYRLTSDRHWRNVEAFRFNNATQQVVRSDYVEILHATEQIGNRMDATFRTALPAGVKNTFVAGFDVNRIDHGRDFNTPFSGTSSVDPYDFDNGYFQHVVPTTPEYRARTEQYAFFAEDQLALSKELSLVAGVRLDRPSVTRTHLRNAALGFDQDFSYFTWRAGAVYTPVPGLAFYGQYATGVDPMGTGLLSLNNTQALLELATGRQIEVGVKQSFWGGRGEWTLAAYDIEKQNLLSADPNAPNITRQVGQQSSRGIEFSLAMQLLDTLRYEGNVALLEAQYDQFITGGVDFSGNRPNNVPEQVVNNWLSWAFLPDWEARVGVQWVGVVYGDDANTVKRPDFTVVNLGLDYHVSDRSTVTLRGFNVFDEVYARSGGSTQWQLAPPRSAELAYRIKF